MLSVSKKKIGGNHTFLKDKKALLGKKSVSQLMNAEVNSGNCIKSGTCIKVCYKDSWLPLVASQQTISGCVRE